MDEFPTASRSSLSDPAGVVESVGRQLVDASFRWLWLRPHCGWEANGLGKRLVAVIPIQHPRASVDSTEPVYEALSKSTN